MTPTPNTLQLFHFNNAATGTALQLSALERNGQAWFSAADVCRAMGIQNSRDAIARLDDDERGVATTDTLGGPQKVSIINESGLYALIFSSRKDSARAFRKWITSVVIPSLRKHGGYINGQEALSTAEQSQTLQVIQQEAQRVGLCAQEEREARSDAFRLLNAGRSRRRTRNVASPSTRKAR